MKSLFSINCTKSITHLFWVHINPTISEILIEIGDRGWRGGGRGWSWGERLAHPVSNSSAGRVVQVGNNLFGEEGREEGRKEGEGNEKKREKRDEIKRKKKKEIRNPK